MRLAGVLQGDQGAERESSVGGAVHGVQRVPLPAVARPQRRAARADAGAGTAVQALRRRDDLPQAQAGGSSRELQARGTAVLGSEAPSAAPEAEEGAGERAARSEEHTSELQSLMRISYAVFCLKKKKKTK